MKANRLRLSIFISSLALIAVLAIQIHWIFQTAEMKEDLFNEKANMVLARTTEAIGSDQAACQEIGACLKEGEKAGTSGPIQLRNQEVKKIDSLLRHYMKFYNVKIRYSFSVAKPSSAPRFDDARFNKSLPFIRTADFELNLDFPDKKQYLMAEMGVPFFSSVVLVVVVLVLFWRTVFSLKKEKEISEHTTDFLNNMTHEFKTPITNISLAGKMMTRDQNLKQEEKIRHYSGIILEENEKLRLQVEQVLSMTALERGEIPMQKTELDFHSLLNDSLRNVRMQVENAGGTLSINLNAEQTIVFGDKTHLANVLCNLFDNAVRYSAGAPQITVSSRNEGEDLVLEVADKGIGISSEYQKKVFEKYFRVPTGDVHNVKGFGLGLAYVQQIAKGHAGSVSVHSEKGKGSTFTLRIPHV
jgi:two-component system phosphate regulon sensor histidine kinase PhoR